MSRQIPRKERITTKSAAISHPHFVEFAKSHTLVRRWMIDTEKSATYLRLVLGENVAHSFILALNARGHERMCTKCKAGKKLEVGHE